MPELPPQPHRRDETHQLILDAAFNVLSNASLHDVLGFLRPTRLSTTARQLVKNQEIVGVRPPAPETVGWHFREADSAHKFDPDQLVDELLDQACAQIVETAQDSRRGYEVAAEAFAATANFDVVAEAIAEDLARYQPGSIDALTDARERVYFMAVALCDDERNVAGKLRRTAERVCDECVAIYDAFLRITHRKPISGYNTRDLAKLVSMLLDGETLRYRFNGNLEAHNVFEAVFRLFWAFTTPEDGPEVDIRAELTNYMSPNKKAGSSS